MSEPVDVSSACGPDALEVIRVPGRTGQRARPEGLIGSLGGDLGGTTGLFLGAWHRDRPRVPVLARAWQCDSGAVPELLGWILETHGHIVTVAGIEAYDARRSARGMTSKAMYELVSVTTGIIAAAGITVTARPPSAVKTWASDKRLRAAGVREVLGKMTDDAFDAARQCLYAAVADGGMRDPLTRRTNR